MHSPYTVKRLQVSAADSAYHSVFPCRPLGHSGSENIVTWVSFR